MSDANQQGKSVKVAICICLMAMNKENVLKLRVRICQLSINQVKLFKLRYVYVRCQSTKKRVKVAVRIYQRSINKEKC